MKAWDIFSWQAPGWPEPHPAVIVSHPDRVANKPDVTVIICASRKATRQPEPNEVILDANDGLDWPTLCKCDLLYTIQKANLVNRRGAVSAERRRLIIMTINRVNGWLLSRLGAAGCRRSSEAAGGSIDFSPGALKHNGRS